MEYHLKIPANKDEIKKLHVGDVIYVTGKIFTARDEAHHMMLEKDKDSLSFYPPPKPMVGFLNKDLF